MVLKGKRRSDFTGADITPKEGLQGGRRQYRHSVTSRLPRNVWDVSSMAAVMHTPMSTESLSETLSILNLSDTSKDVILTKSHSFSSRDSERDETNDEYAMRKPQSRRRTRRTTADHSLHSQKDTYRDGSRCECCKPLGDLFRHLSHSGSIEDMRWHRKRPTVISD
ncbi:hypothetical protein SARC_10357 [Sphaeroforma arctica JP610]|uniref:Uncharacterized protein n=1 Tax=Sphaeroforma arctica JP610 TaxID=667725 RepID=A0A0L0FL35_9EUKA|nr:hypothetical protein SARC_10357 [Sphaeroforma arctica JP610]KNC77176.1 hypothetical protein SARC_10357 [Sphaeroforma arctica JP610]|eukprot:XP_014151078.1 hypothetical protein SARC_10357 [Sphaeroforma arctica JP610]